MRHSARKQHRHHLIFYLKVYHRDSGEQIGYLGDITTDGMMVMSREPLEVDQDWELEIRTVENLAEPRSLFTPARSRWCRQDVNPDFYATGFELLGTPQETTRAIQQLIREIGFQDN